MDSKYSDPTIPGPSDGTVAGATTDMPDRGTSSGNLGMGAPYGADTSMSATNRIGGMGRSTQSDAMEQCYPMGSGDITSNNGDHTSPRGKSMGNAADSDAIDEDEGLPQQIG